MNHRPLAGLKILDFTTLLPGPLGTQMLATMGAEVLRIVRPGKGDLLEQMPPFAGGTSVAGRWLHHGKDVLRLDLKERQDRDQIYDLVGDFDIICEGFRPGVMGRLGLGYHNLVRHQPKLIYASLTGYGQNSSYAQRAGHDINYQALAGLASYNSTTTDPSASGFQVADIAGGSMQLVVALLAAIIERQQTGLGQWLDLAMTDCCFYLNHFHIPLTNADQEPQAGRTLLGGGSFYGIYATSDGGHMSVGSLEPAFAAEFLTILGMPERLGQTLDPAAQPELKRAITQAFAQKTRSQWQEVFAQADCCVEPVLGVAEAAASALAKERQWGWQEPQIPIKFHAELG